MSGMSAQNGKLIGNKEHIRQSLRDIIFTPLGSRTMRRNYGSRLPFLIGNPETSVLDFNTAIAEAIDIETRVELVRSTVKRIDDGSLEIALDLIELASGDQFRAVLA